MRISIVGTGYVGLVTGACFAEKGHEVICVDIDPERVAALNRAESPIYEEGLDALLARHVGGRLRATTDLAAAVAATEATLIAVGTPFDGQRIDLTAVLAAARQIGSALRSADRYHLVVVKSTVVPGTTDGPVRAALEEGSGLVAGTDFGLAMNPEFLSEGQAVRDFLEPDRIVVGALDARSDAVLTDLYRPFPDSVPRLHTNTRTAEMIKYASNALLATLVSFTNELANMGAAIGGIDTVDVMRGVHLSQYFRDRNADGLPPIVAFLRAGCGFGGSCLPKDVSALIAHGKSLGAKTRILDATIDVNRDQPARTVALLRRHWQSLSGIRVAVLGLAFKPDTSDVRESPAFPIIRQLLEAGASVTACDPVATHEARRTLADGRVAYCDEVATAVETAQAVIVVTPWRQFGELPRLLAGRDPSPVLVDARRAFDRRAVPRYEGTGL